MIEDIQSVNEIQANKQQLNKAAINPSKQQRHIYFLSLRYLVQYEMLIIIIPRVNGFYLSNS